MDLLFFALKVIITSSLTSGSGLSILNVCDAISVLVKTSISVALAYLANETGTLDRQKLVVDACILWNQSQDSGQVDLYEFPTLRFEYEDDVIPAE
jgi:hypothetical protein